MDGIVYPFQEKKIEDWINNDYADFWYYEIGANVFPANGAEKKPFYTTKTGNQEWIKWAKSGYQNKSIDENTFNEWKRVDAFKDGMALVCGIMFRGDNKGKWLNVIDCDNDIAIKECFMNGLDSTSKSTLVEQHANKEKAHVYFLTENKPLKLRTAAFTKESREKNLVPSLEVKSEGKQIIYCAPSKHKDGSRIQFLGTRKIKTVDHSIDDKITATLNKFATTVNNTNNTNNIGGDFDPFTIPLAQVVEDGFTISNGDNRNIIIVRLVDSWKIRNPEYTFKILLRMAEDYNKEHCVPPYSADKVKSCAKDGYNYGISKLVKLLKREHMEKKSDEKKQKETEIKNEKVVEQENTTNNTIKEFFQNFTDDGENNGECKYVKLINNCHTEKKESIIFNVSDLSKFDSEEKNNKIYQMLLNEPKKFLKAAAHAANEIYQQKYSDSKKRIFVHVDEVNRKPTIKNILGNKLIGKMVTVNGMITSISPKFNVPDFIVYVCPDGHNTTVKSNENEDVKVPVVCDESSCKHRDFEKKTESTNFEEHRLILLKSSDDFSLSADDLPVLLSNDLVDIIDVGNNVQITGFVKTEQVETRSKKDKPVYRNKIVCSSVKKVDEIDYHITTQDIENFENMTNDEDFYKKLVNSVTPSIVGLSNVKESILLQIVGSAPRKRNDGTFVRGNIHVGTWGAGGVAKTKFAEWLDLHIPKTKFIHSGGATDKGLLLGLEDNAYGGGKSLHAGAFVYCSGGIVLMDEFIRTGEKIMGDLMTTLETGIAGIAKSGHNAKVKADAALFATGNAFEGEWNESDNLAINLKKTTSELQRFDYHWIILDKFDKKHDEKIAYSIVNDVDYVSEEAPYTPEFLYKYTRFIQKFNPVLKKEGEVNKHLVDAYLKLRGDDHAKQAGISPRHLNTMIRSSIISARLHQRNEVTIEDADKAISLMTKMVEQQNISISDSDTYLSHQFNRAMQIINDGPDGGYSMDNLFFKLRNTGTIEDIALTVAELGDESSQSNNIKWRSVIQKLKMSPRINILSRKPLVMAFRNNIGDMTAFM